MNRHVPIEELVRKIEKIETAVQNDFQQYYVDAMSIRHHSDDFTEWEVEVEL